LHPAFAFGFNKLATSLQPVFLPGFDKGISGCLGTLNLAAGAAAFHAGRSINGVSKELKSSFLSTQYSGCHRTRVQTKAELEVASVRSEGSLKLLG